MSPANMSVPPQLGQTAAQVRQQAGSIPQAQIEFLAALIRLKSYTGREGPAVERTLAYTLLRKTP